MNLSDDQLKQILHMIKDKIKVKVKTKVYNGYVHVKVELRVKGNFDNDEIIFAESEDSTCVKFK